MPALVLITAPAGAHPRLRAETLARLKKDGYTLERRLETAAWDDLFEEALTPSLFSQQRIFEVDDGMGLPHRGKIRISGPDLELVAERSGKLKTKSVDTHRHAEGKVVEILRGCALRGQQHQDRRNH